MSSRFIVSLLIMLGFLRSEAQDIKQFLRQVSENNPEILSYASMLEARRAEARTNIYPPGPEASFGYMPGNNSASGVKKTWSVSQRFDFPSRYLAMKNINRYSVRLAELEFDLGRLNVILDALMTIDDYYTAGKKLSLIKKRIGEYETLRDAWKRKLEEGAATLPEYNRILLELSAISLEKANTEAELTSLRQRLDYLSGGRGTIPEGQVNPEEVILPVDSLIKQKLNIHPAFLIPQAEYRLSTGEVSLARSSSLPELMAGYSSEILPSEAYTGPMVGISVPLWSNAGKLKSAKAKSSMAEAAMKAETERLKTEVRREYTGMIYLKSAVDDLRNILKSSGSTSEITTALEEGGITLTEYFSMTGVIFDAELRLIETENRYRKSLALLNDHLLTVPAK
ncbi:MAG TPA: TolC family protein [Bacteroidales bacterium]|nr:TolC family protein [Bacteroidales bacterium]HRR93023.1 TolC family protein [Bacteroidales bacterium]HRT90217.1 TolC family protein [Bacteroidales bacterium]